MNHRFVFLPLCALFVASCAGTPSSSTHPTGLSTSEESVESSQPSVPSSEPSASTSTPSSTPSAPSSASSKEREQYDGIKVYCETSWTHIYAWNGETKLCGDWPGARLKDAGDWKYYEFPDISFANLIFNTGNGGEQTKDLSINTKGVFYYYQNAWYEDEPGSGSSSETSHDLPPVSSANYLNFYQLLVYSFADGNGDGMGDFKGIIDHLDYLTNLGINALWLSPVQPSDSYHAYDCTDYYSINSAYEVTVGGTKYDFAKLLHECHAKGVKVVMDMVFNHTSPNHVWYSQHRDWYGNDNKFGFPEFDFDKTAVREAIKDVGKYWVNQGVDGFRLDAAYWVYNSGHDRDQKNFAWWQEFSKAVKEVNPDCYLVGEVLDSDHDLAFTYTACGFDSTFDFEAPKQTYLAFNGGASSFAGSVKADQEKIAGINKDAIMARALSNHDIGRFSAAHEDASDKAYYIENGPAYKIATALNALTPGNAYIYYGDELGLKGTCEDTRPNWYYDMNFRTPMPFSSGRTSSVKYFEGFHGSGVTTSTTLSGKTADEDVNDPLSAYGVLKKALAIKKASEALQKGSVSASQITKANLVDYAITYNQQTARFFCNTSSSAMTLDVQGSLTDYIATSSNVPSLSNGKLTLPAYSIAFIG